LRSTLLHRCIGFESYTKSNSARPDLFADACAFEYADSSWPDFRTYTHADEFADEFAVYHRPDCSWPDFCTHKHTNKFADEFAVYHQPNSSWPDFRTYKHADQFADEFAVCHRPNGSWPDFCAHKHADEFADEFALNNQPNSPWSDFCTHKHADEFAHEFALNNQPNSSWPDFCTHKHADRGAYGARTDIYAQSQSHWPTEPRTDLRAFNLSYRIAIGHANHKVSHSQPDIHSEFTPNAGAESKSNGQSFSKTNQPAYGKSNTLPWAFNFHMHCRASQSYLYIPGCSQCHIIGRLWRAIRLYVASRGQRWICQCAVARFRW